MKDKIIAKATRLFYTSKLQLKKHSPEILLGVGIAGTVASAVIACKQTLKVQAILDEKNDTVDKIHECLDKSQKGEIEESYTEEDSQKDLTITYVQTGVKLVRLYAPAILLGSLSISSIVAGHKILSKRNAAIAAAYAVVDRGFKTYRKNVVERFGENVDKELRLGVKAENVKKKDKDLGKDASGKNSHKHDAFLEYSDNPEIEKSQYSRFFDSASAEFQKDPEYNMMFLRRQQDYANELLKSRGYLFLNEVYDLLDIPRSKAGQIVGWIYNKDNPNGDNYVDFGLYNGDEANRRFVNGLEYNILLDFNVDGVIYDMI